MADAEKAPTPAPAPPPPSAGPGGDATHAPAPASPLAAAPAAQGRPLWKRALMILVLLALAAPLAIWGAKVWLHSRDHESTDDAFLDGHVVRVGARIAGHVLRVSFADNEEVREGKVLVEIDPRDLEARLSQARAAVRSAKANADAARADVEQAKTALGSSEANVGAARAQEASAATDVSRTALDLERYEALVKEQSLAEQRLDHARTEARAAASQLEVRHTNTVASEASLAEARARITSLEAAVAAADAAIARAEASQEEAALQLSYARVEAPAAGRVARKGVEPGDYVQAGQALLAIVTPSLWVTANFKETQLERMRPGQPVVLRVDAYPGRELRGRVESFQRGSGARFSLFPPENATGNYVKVVQRVPVKIVFDEPPPADMTLGPGMSVEPDVDVGTAPP